MNFWMFNMPQRTVVLLDQTASRGYEWSEDSLESRVPKWQM
jgi:hypothetical protein